MVMNKEVKELRDKQFNLARKLLGLEDESKYLLMIDFAEELGSDIYDAESAIVELAQERFPADLPKRYYEYKKRIDKHEVEEYQAWYMIDGYVEVKYQRIVGCWVEEYNYSVKKESDFLEMMNELGFEEQE